MPDTWKTLKVKSRRDFVRSAASLGGGLAAASLAPFAAYSSAQVLTQNAAPPAIGRFRGKDSLGAHAAARGLLYGCAVDVHALKADPAYASLIREQCSILVAENAMKWGPLRPSADTFRFDEVDTLVAFAEAKNIKMRGHNLAWHRGNPKWFDAELTAANARKLLVTHIQTVMGRYAGRMHSWDVVNEAIDVKDGRPDGMRNTVWLRLAGDDYLDLAFRTAREADPKALLTYNEYGIESDDPEAEKKRAATLAMLRRMLDHKVPLDALGVQSHIAVAGAHGPTYGPGLVRFLSSVRALGLQVFITEMEVNDRTLAADIPQRDTAVAAAYKQYLDLVLAEPAVRAVLTWGITNRHTWLNGEDSRADGQPERPLPFDSNYHPTQAFSAIRDAFDTGGADVRRTEK